MYLKQLAEDLYIFDAQLIIYLFIYFYMLYVERQKLISGLDALKC